MEVIMLEIGHLVCATHLDENRRPRYTIGTVTETLEKGMVKVTTPDGEVHEFHHRELKSVLRVVIEKDRKIRKLDAFRHKSVPVLENIRGGGTATSAEAEAALTIFEKQR